MALELTELSLQCAATIKMSETIAPSSDPVYRLTSAHSDPIAQNSQSNTMNKAITASANPFMDPVLEQEAAGQESAFSVDSTLAVGKNASLTLATDSLIVLGNRSCKGYCGAAQTEGQY